MPHEHPPGEYCDGCRPVLEADYGLGEQFWKHWSSAEVPYVDGRRVRFKVLSKRAAKGGAPVYVFAIVREFSDGPRELFGRGEFEHDATLTAFVAGVEFALLSVLGLPGRLFKMVDFRPCDTYDKYLYKLREGTTFDVWEGPPNAP